LLTECKKVLRIRCLLSLQEFESGVLSVFGVLWRSEV
jgi:hypothetical protein